MHLRTWTLHVALKANWRARDLHFAVEFIFNFFKNRVSCFAYPPGARPNPHAQWMLVWRDQDVRLETWMNVKRTLLGIKVSSESKWHSYITWTKFYGGTFDCDISPPMRGHLLWWTFHLPTNQLGTDSKKMNPNFPRSCLVSLKVALHLLVWRISFKKCFKKLRTTRGATGSFKLRTVTTCMDQL